MSFDLFVILQWLIFAFFLALFGSHLALNVFALRELYRYGQARLTGAILREQTNFYPPVSVICPVYNEEARIVAHVRALLALQHSEFEILVVNDGSTDTTMVRLIGEFGLVPFPEAYRVRLSTQTVSMIFRSTKYPNLRVVDKLHGGKADALNAGINCARYPLFCPVDADQTLHRQALHRLVQPYIEDIQTVVVSGTVRILHEETAEKNTLPSSWLVRLQIIEYLRSALFSQLGWTPFNALLNTRGTFGLWQKECVVQVGGYHAQVLDTGMDMLWRIHRFMRRTTTPYRITLMPEPICWAAVAEDLLELRRQRQHLQHRLCEIVALHGRGLVGGRPPTVLGWVTVPWLVIFEVLGPLVEILSYLFMAGGALLGWVSLPVAVVFLMLTLSLGILSSVTALILEERSFHVYPRLSQLWRLLVMAVSDNLGYRQLVTGWRVEGLWQWLTGLRKGKDPQQAVPLPAIEQQKRRVNPPLS